MKTLKRFFRLAFRQNLVSNNPFENYKLRTEESNRCFLEQEKLKKLTCLNNLTDSEKRAHSMFVFQCCSGFRHSDILRLGWKNLNGNFIVLNQAKTKHEKVG